MTSRNWKGLCAALFGRGPSTPSPSKPTREETSPAAGPADAGQTVAADVRSSSGPSSSSNEGIAGAANESVSASMSLRAAASIPGPQADPPRPSKETQVSLERSLKWRTQVLLNTPGLEDPKGDGRRLVDSLLDSPETVIRQLPQAAQKAIRVSRDPNSGTRDLVLLFERDPTLTQTLLRQANSPWYRRSPEPIMSIVTAVQRIGAKGVENIFLESVVHGLLCRPGGVYNRMVSTEWAMMLNSSAQARNLARPFGVDPDTAQSLGLLHDVGKLVCFDRISILRGSLRRDVEISDSFLSVLFDRLHEPLGGQACLQWGLGGEAAYAVAHHHRQPCPENREPMTELLYVADHLNLGAARPEDWERVWLKGALTADREAIEKACRRAA